MNYFLIKAKNIFLDILFPPVCLNCLRYLNENKFLCDNCYSLIKFNNTLFCPICRSRLANNKKICHFDSSYLLAAAGNYDDPILQNLIHCFKYRKMDFLAPLLAEIIIKYINSLWTSDVRWTSDVLVIPVPLHFFREKSRGFNQAKLLAEIFARRFNLPVIDALKRIKNNKSQAKCKDSESRAKNVINCFKINPESVKGKNIILVDDVFTSGATMAEAVKILKQNGCRKIIALVLARA